MSQEKDFVVPDKKTKKPKFNYISENFEVVHSVEGGGGIRIEAVYGGHFEYIIYSSEGYILEHSDCGYGEFLRAFRDGLSAVLDRY